MSDSISLPEAFVHRMALLCRPTLLLVIGAGASVVAPLLSILCIGWFLWRLVGQRSSSSTSHGSARWATVSDAVETGCVFQNQGLPLGLAAGMEPASGWERLKALLFLPASRSREAVSLAKSNHRNAGGALMVRVPDRIPHMAYFGASGSGKSTCISVPMLLSFAGSLVCLDPKGELARIAGRQREKRFGQRVYVIDPFDVAAGSGLQKARINPLSLYAGDERRILDESRRFAQSLVVRTGKEADQFWPNASETVLTAVLTFLMAHARPEEATLNNMRNILASPKLMDQMLEEMLKSDKCFGLLPRAAGQLQQLAGQTKSSVMSVANSHIDFLDSPAILETLSESTFDPRNLVNDKITVFVCLPVERLASLQGLQRILISTLINVVFEAGEDPDRRVQFLLDEAATLGPMESMYAATQFGRSFSLRMTYLFQSTSQLERVFPDSQKDDVLATVGRCFVGTNDYSTAKDVSEWMGDTTIWTRNDQSGTNAGKTVQHGIADQNPSRNTGTSNSTSFNEAGRSLLRAEEVLQLPKHLAIALLPGIPPMLLEKVPYWKKQRSHFFGRLLQVLCDLFVISLTLCCVAAAMWLLHAGPAHPLIEEFRREVLR